MKTKFLTAMALSFFAMQAHGATLSMNNYVEANTPDVENIVTQGEDFDTATDGPLQYFSTDAETNANGVRSHSFSGVDTSEGIGRAIAHIQKDPNSGETSSSAIAETAYAETYSVQGSGYAEVDFTVYGAFKTLTDDDTSLFLSAFGQIVIDHAGSFFSDALDTTSTADPYFGLKNGQFHRTFSFLFEVGDGDTFDIETHMQAQARSLGLQFASFDAETDVKTGLRVRGIEGAQIVPGDGTQISPVPLPASGLFLITPIAAFIAMRRRKKALA